MILEKIISGGQTGADLGGVKAAKEAGLLTGGWMPQGFLNLEGYFPEYKELYNMVEYDSPKYSPRTFKNVIESDGTVRFAVNWESAGELCTLKAVNMIKKPYFDVHVIGSTQPNELAEWIIKQKIKVLNVAGNSEKTAKGIEEFVIGFMLETINLLRAADTLVEI